MCVRARVGTTTKSVSNYIRSPARRKEIPSLTFRIVFVRHRKTRDYLGSEHGERFYRSGRIIYVVTLNQDSLDYPLSRSCVSFGANGDWEVHARTYTGVVCISGVKILQRNRPLESAVLPQNSMNTRYVFGGPDI